MVKTMKKKPKTKTEWNQYVLTDVAGKTKRIETTLLFVAKQQLSNCTLENLHLYYFKLFHVVQSFLFLCLPVSTLSFFRFFHFDRRRHIFLFAIERLEKSS